MMRFEEYKGFAQQLWSPLILTIASPEIQNAPEVVSLLQKCGDLKALNDGVGVPIRTSAERPLRLHNWRLRFHTPKDMVQPTAQEADKILEACLNSAVQSNQDIVTDVQALQSADDPTPWFTAYRQQYLHLMSFGEHETMDNPIACFIIAPSTIQGDFAGHFMSVLNTPDLAPRQKQMIADVNVPKHFIVLHTDSQPPSIELDGRVAAARSSLPGPCHIVVMNNAPEKQLTGFIHEITVRSLIPGLESRIRQLDQSVTAIRRGLKNQIKSLLFRGSRTDVAPTTSPSSTGASPGSATGSTAYGPGSTEYQIRLLGDLSILVGDYETALSTLRLLAADYKTDKAYKHYAGVQEAMAVAIILSEGNLNDAAGNFKEAFYRYQLCDSIRYCTRVAILFGGFLEAIKRPVDASYIYMKAHNQEVHSRAGLLLERAAHCFLHARPMRLRKFAFHLVLAGLRYTQCNLQLLARRVNAQALDVYEGHQWALPEEHLNETLGKLLGESGDYSLALDHFASALACSYSSPGMQKLHYKQFTDALQKATAHLGQAPVLELSLPAMDLSEVGVSYAGQSSFANFSARQVDRDIWRQLESALPIPESINKTWLESSSRANLQAAEVKFATCVGEDVGVDIPISNPLQIDLAITHLRLLCSFQPLATDSTADTASPTFHVREERITLRGGERMLVNLRVKPLRPGTLTLQGVAWTIGGIAKAEKKFNLEKVIVPGNNRAKLANGSSGVLFEVLPPMPRLEAQVEGLSDTASVGQIIHCSLRLKNTGSMSLQGIVMSCFHGEAWLDRPEQPLMGDAPSTIEVATKQGGLATFKLPQKMKLGVNAEMILPLWLRISKPGPVSIHMAWYYEPLIKPNGLRFRTLRASYNVGALPSLQIQATITSTPSFTGASLLQIHALNLQGLETFKLTGLHVTRGDWVLEPLEGGNNGVAKQSLELENVLGPEASSSMRYLLHPKPTDTSSGVQLSPAELFLINQPLSLSKELQNLDINNSNKNKNASNTAAVRAGDSGAVDIGVSWESVGGSGIHCLNQLQFQEGPPIRIKLIRRDNAPILQSGDGFPTVQLDLEIKNMLSVSAAIHVDTGNTGTAVVPPGSPTLTPAVVTAQASSKKYVWCGPCRLHIDCVGPQQVVRIPLSIGVLHPGAMLVDDYCVAWVYSEGFTDLNGSMMGPVCQLFV